MYARTCAMPRAARPFREADVNGEKCGSSLVDWIRRRAMGVVAAGARADVTTEKGASILIFPKVRADATYDTIIQITNTDNMVHLARCFYVNAANNWQETDFTIL